MDWEFRILNFIQNNIKNDFFDIIIPLTSPIYFLGAIIALTIIITFCFKKTRDFSKTLMLSLAIGYVNCNLIFKLVIGRLRPYQLNSSFQLLVRPESDTSFPSGHTFFAFTFATVCFLYDKRLGIVMYIFAAAMAFSRLYLYVHFPTDVIFGAFLGIINAAGIYYLEKAILKKNNVQKLDSKNDN